MADRNDTEAFIMMEHQQIMTGTACAVFLFSYLFKISLLVEKSLSILSGLILPLIMVLGLNLNMLAFIFNVRPAGLMLMVRIAKMRRI